MPEHSNPFELEVLPQPDDTTCGPTSLHAVYRHWGVDIPLERVIDEVTPLPHGGTLAVSLACHALRHGFDATIYTYNLQIFDPTWFENGVDLADRLRRQVRQPTDTVDLPSPAGVGLTPVTRTSFPDLPGSGPTPPRSARTANGTFAL
ncbi:MAG TPA: hypothetical protein VML95_05940 [Longimicrobiales bacterium]|nr:hypothetical protein [Longimicrobiales bacterium]